MESFEDKIKKRLCEPTKIGDLIEMYGKLLKDQNRGVSVAKNAIKTEMCSKELYKI